MVAVSFQQHKLFEMVTENLLGRNMLPAVLKSRSAAAELGRAVL